MNSDQVLRFITRIRQVSGILESKYKYHFYGRYGMIHSVIPIIGGITALIEAWDAMAEPQDDGEDQGPQDD